MERFNTPLTKEAAKSLLALDLEDKVITSYEKLDEWYTAWGGQCYMCHFPVERTVRCLRIWLQGIYRRSAHLRGR